MRKTLLPMSSAVPRGNAAKLAGGLLVVVTLAGLCVALPGRAAAQEVQVRGPLAGAPAVRRQRLYRRGRFSIAPQVSISLQDEYYRHLFFGAQLQYHFTDWLGLGLWGAFSPVQLPTSVTDQVVERGLQSTPQNRLSVPDGRRFEDQIGVIQWMAGAQLTFIPLRGKLALFQKLFIDTDLYIFAGAAAVGLQERPDINGGAALTCAESSSVDQCATTQTRESSGITVSPMFGAGLTFYVSGFFGISFEYRALPFAWNTSGTDEAGDGSDFPDGIIDSNDRLFHFNQIFSIGFVFHLPTAVGVGD